MRPLLKADAGAAAVAAPGATSVPASGARRRRRPSVSASAIPFRMPPVRPPTFPAHVVDVRAHGAAGDGTTDCTRGFAAAIAACAAAGGGRVVIPPGHWLTAAIHLRSNIDLHLAEGASVRFIADPSRYLPAVFVRWGGQECYSHSPLIYARNSRNVAITGRGTIHAEGRPWWAWAKAEPESAARLYQMVLRGVPVEQRRFGTDSAPLRPSLIGLVGCTNVLLEDLAIEEPGPFWNVHLTYCRNAHIRRLWIAAPDGPNTDGIVIDSSRNVLIEDCDLHTGGDCVALKSGLNEDGWRVGRATENVVVRNVRAHGGDAGIGIGSEMSGGIRNILVDGGHIDTTEAGIRFKAARGRGGVVDGVFVRDLTIGHVRGDAVQLTTAYSTFVSPDGRPPAFANIHVRNVTCARAGAAAARFVGLHDRPLRDVSLENVTIAADEGLQCTAAEGLRLTNVNITPQRGPALSIRDSQRVTIEGLAQANPARVLLDLRGRRTQDVRLLGKPNQRVRPSIVLGIDVPKDALVHE